MPDTMPASTPRRRNHRKTLRMFVPSTLRSRIGRGTLQNNIRGRAPPPIPVAFVVLAGHNEKVRPADGSEPVGNEGGMKTRRLGNTGLKVSEICLGTMTFGHQSDQQTSFAILDTAADRGVSFIDTADAYPVPPTPETAGRTEEIVGAWLEGRRDRFVVATKCRIRVGH